jgi:hypothetical protein
MGRTKGSKNRTLSEIKQQVEEIKAERRLPSPEQMQVILQKIAEEESKRIIGWINIYKEEHQRSVSFYTGADIHETKEKAERINSTKRVATIQISFEV